MTYQQFIEKNEENKANFKRAVKSGQLNPMNINQFTSSKIVSVYKKRAGGFISIVSNINNSSAGFAIYAMVNLIMNNNTVHITNPSRIKTWRGFTG